MTNKPPALVCIDIQKGFKNPFWGRRNNPDAELRMEEILGHWRTHGWPVFHVQHLSKIEDSPLNPRQAGVKFMDFSTPIHGEPVLQKSVNSGFIGTDLEQTLRQYGTKEIICMGFTTDHCISTTVRMASNLGFKVLLSEEAVCTFDRMTHAGEVISADLIHRAALASLHQEFATVHSQSAIFTYLESL